MGDTSFFITNGAFGDTLIVTPPPFNAQKVVKIEESKTSSKLLDSQTALTGLSLGAIF